MDIGRRERKKELEKNSRISFNFNQSVFREEGNLLFEGIYAEGLPAQ
jgi:hypothetical protein